MKTLSQRRRDKLYLDLGVGIVPRNTRCAICGRMFHYLGLASHRAACSRRVVAEREAKGETE